jgi:xanthine dehydrogenase YagR molybdenum-binding subunit
MVVQIGRRRYPSASSNRPWSEGVGRGAGEFSRRMEPYASTVIFERGGKLTIYDKTRGVQNVQRYVCSVLEMEPDDVRVISPFVGGAFGSGLRPQYQVVLAALAARALQRSVRVVLTRQQMYGLGYRPAMIQQIALGANAGGTLDAIAHEAVTVTSQYEDFHRQETGWSGLLYTCANAKYTHKLARLDLATSCDMQAPSAATAVYALESAMDELAVALKLDPLELGLRFYSDHDQHSDQPYSSKNLRDCYRQGAEAFGWERRNPEPRSMRDGTELVGWAWRQACGRRCKCRSRCASSFRLTAMRRFPARPPTSAQAPTRS